MVETKYKIKTIKGKQNIIQGKTIEDILSQVQSQLNELLIQKKDDGDVVFTISFLPMIGVSRKVFEKTL